MPSETSASSQSIVPRGCSPSLAVSVSPVSGPSARVVNNPSSTALSSALEPQKARPNCRIASGTGCLFVMAVLLIGSARGRREIALGGISGTARVCYGTAPDRAITRFSRQCCRLVVIVLQRAGRRLGWAAANVDGDGGEGGSDLRGELSGPAVFVDPQRGAQAGRGLVRGSREPVHLGFGHQHLGLGQR